MCATAGFFVVKVRLPVSQASQALPEGFLPIDGSAKYTNHSHALASASATLSTSSSRSAEYPATTVSSRHSSGLAK